MVNLASNYLNAGNEAKRWGTAHESIVPYQAFQTKDNRWITVGAGNNTQFQELCESLKLPELKSNPKYSTTSNRVEHRDELLQIIQDKFQTKTIVEWLDVFQNCKFPYGPVNNMENAFADPQVHIIIQDIHLFLKIQIVSCTNLY